jgi:Phosphotransferase enzyme family
MCVGCRGRATPIIRREQWRWKRAGWRTGGRAEVDSKVGRLHIAASGRGNHHVCNGRKFQGWGMWEFICPPSFVSLSLSSAFFAMSTPPSSHWALRDNTFHQADEVIAATDFHAIKSHVLDLSGQECTIDVSKFAYGGVNVVFEAHLSTGDVWIVRIRRPVPAAALPTIGMLVVSEVTTMKYIRAHTTILIPEVYGFDASGRKAGSPYILMQAMPGHRIGCGNFGDPIPKRYKQRVYAQFAQIIGELASLPFAQIGMLYPSPNDPDMVIIGQIQDQNCRISPIGPFSDSLSFYVTRHELLAQSQNSTTYTSVETEATIPERTKNDPDEEAKFRDAIAELVVGKDTMFGPFYLAHPDFQVTNFLFDDEFNVTAALDWSGVQTMPAESASREPHVIVPQPDPFVTWQWGNLLSAKVLASFVSRRALFKTVFARSTTNQTLVTLMYSSRAYFARCLDKEGMLGATAGSYFILEECERFRNEARATS